MTKKQTLMIFSHIWQLSLYTGVLFATLIWILELNLFSWSPKFSFIAIICPIAVIILSLLAYVNSRKVHPNFNIILNTLMCVIAVLQVFVVLEERTTLHSALYGLN